MGVVQVGTPEDMPLNEESPPPPQQVVGAAVEENNMNDYNERYRGYDEAALTERMAQLSDIAAYQNNRPSTKRILQAPS